MNKEKKIVIMLTFLFGICFMTVGLSLYDVFYHGWSLLVGLSNPAYWILGLVFGLMLAVGTWMTRRSISDGKLH